MKNVLKTTVAGAICSAMGRETISKSRVSPKNDRSRGKFAVKTFVLLAVLSFSYSVFAQDESDWGWPIAAQISFGYIPNQALSVTENSSAFDFDISCWTGRIGGLFSYENMTDNFDDDSWIGFAFGGGVGIRGYRNIPSENILNTTDPYQKSITRFDIHIGPALTLGSGKYANFVLSPQFGLWYAGMSNDGPKVNGTIALQCDLIIMHSVFVGVTYRATSPRLVSTDWNIDTMANSYILIKPALEFKIGIFL